MVLKQLHEVQSKSVFLKVFPAEIVGYSRHDWISEGPNCKMNDPLSIAVRRIKTNGICGRSVDRPLHVQYVE